MSKHRQEFILDAVGFGQIMLAVTQRVLGALSVGNVARCAGNGFDFTVDAEHRCEDVIVESRTLRAGEWHLTTDRLPGGDDMVDFAVVHGRMPGFVAELEAIASDRL